MVDGYFPAVDAIAEWTEDIEEDMFSAAGRRSRDILQGIFSVKKSLLEMRKTIAPSRDVVNVLLRRDNACRQQRGESYNGESVFQGKSRVAG